MLWQRPRRQKAAEDILLTSDATLLPPGLRVLLVEDEPLIAIHGEDILRALGVEHVVWVRSLAEGIDALDSKQFHAAFLDLRLGMDSSYPLAQRLMSLNVPFGFITGLQDDALPAELKDRPILAKPFTPEQLRDLLLRLLGKA
jgi:CheY-like chemotaxis protein